VFVRTIPSAKRATSSSVPGSSKRCARPEWWRFWRMEPQGRCLVHSRTTTSVADDQQHRCEQPASNAVAPDLADRLGSPRLGPIPVRLRPRLSPPRPGTRAEVAEGELQSSGRSDCPSGCLEKPSLSSSMLKRRFP